MSRPPRMRDVAALAGVATMTVSRVINGNAHVTEETRKRVFDAVEKLDFRPNVIARSLRKQRSRQIGVIVPNIHDPFFATCAQAISLVAKQHVYSVNIAMSDEDPNAEYDEALLMLQRHVEGLVVIPSAGPVTRLTGNEFARTPIVTLDRPIAGTSFDSVVVQNQRGAELAVEHLIGHGHRRIAFLGLSPQLYTMRTRFAGYRRAMSVAGLKFEGCFDNFTQDQMMETLKTLVKRRTPVTALFCGNNLTTRHALHGLSTLGVSVPEKIALAGFDDFETADLLRPPVTVVRQPMVNLGETGARLLFSRLAQKDRPLKRQQLVLPVELIIRDSCGAHPDGST